MKYAIVSKVDEKSHIVSDKIRKTLQGAGWIEDEKTAELIILCWRRWNIIILVFINFLIESMI